MSTVIFCFFKDVKLKKLCVAIGTSDWSIISSNFPYRTEVQCQQRWEKVLNPNLVKGAWTKEVFISSFNLEKFLISFNTLPCLFLGDQMQFLETLLSLICHIQIFEFSEEGSSHQTMQTEKCKYKPNYQQLSLKY